MAEISAGWLAHPRTRSGLGSIFAICLAILVVCIIPPGVHHSTQVAIRVSLSESGIRGDEFPPTLSMNQVLTVNTPPPREWGRMAYDAADGYVVLFGGKTPGVAGGDLSDTWKFSRDTWTDITNQSPRSPDFFNAPGASITYDPVDKEVLLVGTSATNSTEETWAFSGGTWRQLHPATEPSPRWYAAFAYDVADQCAVLYGGLSVYASGNESWPSDTWVFKQGNWSQIVPSGPSGPYQTVQEMAYDPSDGYVVRVSTSSTDNHLQTWAFQGGSWTSLGYQGPSVDMDLITFDPRLGSIIALQGGYSFSNTTTQVWQFRSGQWNSTFVPGEVEQLSGLSSLVYDSADGYPMVFSSPDSFNVTGPEFSSQVWKLDSTSLGSAPLPALRASPSTVGLGGDLNLTGSVTGGYGYIWFKVQSGVPGCVVFSDNATVSCTPGQTGSYTATLTVLDQAGRQSEATATITVVSFPAEVILGAGVGIAAVLFAASVISRRSGAPKPPV